MNLSLELVIIKNQWRKLNWFYPFTMGFVGILLYSFYKLSILYKIFILLIGIGNIKLVYDCSQYLDYTLLDMIKLYKSTDIDMDIVYLIYKNRNNPSKLKNLFETNPELKLLFTKPIKKFITNK